MTAWLTPEEVGELTASKPRAWRAQRVFLGRRGPYTLSGAESTLQRVRERAGVEDVRLHDLRRKAASDVSLEHAQELLGHADGAVTKRHYRARIEPVKPVR